METSGEKLPFERDPSEARELIGSGVRLVDVRTVHEFDAARIPGAERIGLEDLASRREEFRTGDPVLFYCRIGNRSAMAAQAFAEAGFDATSLRGGIEQWISEGMSIEPEDGYVAEPGEAAAILEARSRAASQ
jgi:rhodanese-related sulfurtransferase